MELTDFHHTRSHLPVAKVACELPIYLNPLLSRNILNPAVTYNFYFSNVKCPVILPEFFNFMHLHSLNYYNGLASIRPRTEASIGITNVVNFSIESMNFCYLHNLKYADFFHLHMPVKSGDEYAVDAIPVIIQYNPMLFASLSYNNYF
jgi:hypothetical protein